MNNTQKSLTPVPSRVGRPTKYDKDYGDKLALKLQLYLFDDNSLEDACESIGISKPTFYKLCSLSPRLNEAFQKRDKPKGGRPAIFTKEYADAISNDLPQMFIRGESIAQVCKKLEMGKDSFKKLCELSPKFAAAYAQGLDYAEAWWTETGQMGSVGKIKINSATWIFNMKNRFKWVDRVEHIGDGLASVTPTLNTKQLSTEALRELTAAREDFPDEPIKRSRMDSH